MPSALSFPKHHPDDRLRAARLARRLRFAAGLGLAAGSVFFVPHAWAQTSGADPASLPPARAADEGLRRQEERSREQLQRLERAPSVLRPEAPQAAQGLPAVDSPCFVIDEIRLDGADATRFSWLKHEAVHYLNRCIQALMSFQWGALLEPPAKHV